MVGIPTYFAFRGLREEVTTWAAFQNCRWSYRGRQAATPAVTALVCFSLMNVILGVVRRVKQHSNRLSAVLCVFH